MLVDVRLASSRFYVEAKPHALSHPTKQSGGTASSNGEVEGPPRSARWRQGRTISQRPRRQAASASRPPPTIVRRHPPHLTLSQLFQSACHSTPSTMRKSRSATFPSTRSAC